jgi:phosphatidylserine decarboxylase
MSSRYPHPAIAREGWTYIGCAFGLALLASGALGCLWALPLWLLLVYLIVFFRDPERAIPAEPGAVLSPADGRVIGIERTTDPYLKRDALKISIYMGPFDVHANRSPVDGEVRQLWYTPGRFLNATLDKASEHNERNAVWIRCADRIDITCVQIAGLLTRRILCNVSAGEHLRRGQRYGFIRFGSRMDVYLPPHSRPRAGLGDKVLASTSVLATLCE